ncbi:DNA (cytosine-5-)-methyltransferase [Calothrix sp. FACHB-1219]|uniref:DNA cytosine methyltransferase n=1 Tax=unclassified Calothrix TaxID=2619626 RepID=UPI001684D130|nr:MULTISPECIES: DNA (cytosine-5-)-methyltransferase [unclassified Calothrix]MBD2202332.1 DNA (cytosine-5-)-methyltransferase [Calothrix sp. FACHB-168]MBD2217738.1 DNA (cytosine-5-)-methyltransferase [Calothrix sp. FACHB-1219]
MRPKSGLPKRKALKRKAIFEYAFKDNPNIKNDINPTLIEGYNSENYIKAISLFSGCGGLDMGFLGGFTFLNKKYEALPYKIVHAYDIDEKATQTYALNLSNDVTTVDLTCIDISSLPPANILLGGFPCQDFSSCGLKQGFKGARGELYTVMKDYMNVHKPEIVVGENVPFLEKLENGYFLRYIIKEFESVGYIFKVWKIYCPDFGLPQSRTRLFLIGVRSDIKSFPKPPTPELFFQYVSIDQAIDDLVAITDESVPNQSQYFVATKATKGAGQGDQKSKKGEIAYTVRANTKARVHFHYSLDRRLTVRECARLQSFPDEFVFPHSASQNIIQIGNAVPPIIGNVIAKQIYDFIKNDLYAMKAHAS